MSFVRELEAFSEYARLAKPELSHAVISVTERYARQMLKIKKMQPLRYKQLALTCRGSDRWRASRAA